MKELVTKFSKSRQVVLDPCDGNFSTAKACMMVLKHCRFVGRQSDAACFAASMPSVAEVFARQVLNEESDIVGSKRVRGAVKIYLEAAKVIEAKRRTII